VADLKERFSVINGPRIQQLKAKLADCKQHVMTMVNYYGKLKTLWDELEMYEPVLTYKGCKCNISKKLQLRGEDGHVHQFLMGLDDTLYETARSNLLATDPLPSLNRVYSIMVQEERVRSVACVVDERREVVTLVAQTPARGQGHIDGKDTNVVCSHCNRTGHDSSNYFLVIRYPDWWGDRLRGDRTGQNFYIKFKFLPCLLGI